jgi:hypothetical protein
MGLLCRLAEEVGDEFGTSNNQWAPVTSSFREITASWLREQGDWNGSKAISEGWVLLEGRACEIARAEAQLDLKQAHKKGAVNDYMQSLRRRGHVGLANAGMAVLRVDVVLGWKDQARKKYSVS